MLLPRKLRRVLMVVCFLMLFLVCTPILLLGIRGVMLSTREIEVAWPVLLVLVVSVLCLLADGRTDPSRRRYRRIGLVLTAPLFALCVIMLSGIYFYQNANRQICLRGGCVHIYSGSPAAIASLRPSGWPPGHRTLVGNWSGAFVSSWRDVARLAWESLDVLSSSPQGTVFGWNMTTGAGIPVDFLEIPVTALLLLTGLPTLLLFAKCERKPEPTGFCLQCGYNLTGNTSGVCSECGLAISPSETKIA